MADISVAVVLDDSQYSSKLDNISKNTQAFTDKTKVGLDSNTEAMKKLSEQAEMAKTKMEALSAAIAGMGMAEFINHLLEASAKTIDMAMAIGVSTAALIEMGRAGAVVGKTTEDISTMMLKMDQSAQQAADGGAKQQAAYAKLGITLKDVTTLAPDELFKKASAALAEMGIPGERVAATMAIFGKNAKDVNWAELNESMKTTAGTGQDVADSMQIAKEVMVDLKVKAQAVQDQFLVMIQPMLEWIEPFTKGTDGAKIAAEALGIAMGAMATAATVWTGVKVWEGMATLAAALTSTTFLTGKETAAIVENVVATAEEIAIKLKKIEINATLGAAIATNLRAVIAETEAIIANDGAMETNAATTNRLLLAKIRLAEQEGLVTGAAALEATGIGGAAVVEGAAIAPTVGLTGAMAGLAATVTAVVWPLALFAATVVGATAGTQALWSVMNGGSGANYLSDALGITNSELDDMAAKAALADEALKKIMSDRMGMKEGEGMDTWDTTTKPTGTAAGNDQGKAGAAAALQNLKNQYDAMRLNNSLAQERLGIEIASAGLSDRTKADALAAEDARIAQAKELQKINAEIAKIQAEPPPVAGFEGSNNKAARIAVLQAEAAEVTKNTDLFLLQKGALVAANDQHKEALFYLDLQQKVIGEIADLDRQTANQMVTEDQKRIDAIEKRVQAEIAAAVKIKQAQLGDTPITSDQKGDIEKKVRVVFEPETSKMDEYNRKLDTQAIEKQTADTRLTIEKNIADIKLQSDQLTMNADQIKVDNIHKQMNAEIEAQMKIITLQSGQAAADAAHADIVAKVSTMYQPEIDAMDQLINKSKLFQTGWDKALADYTLNANDSSKAAANAFTTATKGIEDAFVSFAKTGKLSFSDLITSMVEQLLRSDIQSALAGLFKAMSGGSSGSGMGMIGTIFSGLGSLMGMAGGGSATGGQPIIVGENGPEVFIPGGSGSIIPNGGGDNGSANTSSPGGGFATAMAQVTTGFASIMAAPRSNVSVGSQFGTSPSQAPTPNNSSATNVTYTINAVDASSFKQLVSSDPKFIYGVFLQGQKMMPGQ